MLKTWCFVGGCHIMGLRNRLPDPFSPLSSVQVFYIWTHSNHELVSVWVSRIHCSYDGSFHSNAYFHKNISRSLVLSCRESAGIIDHWDGLFSKKDCAALAECVFIARWQWCQSPRISPRDFYTGTTAAPNGSFHSHGGTPIAGWFKRKIPI